MRDFREKSKRPDVAKGLPEMQLPAALTAADGWEKSLGADKAQPGSTVWEMAKNQRAIAESFENFNKLRATRDPRITPAQHLENIAKQAKALEANVQKRYDTMRTRIRDHREALNQEIEQRIMVPRKGVDPAEIRAVLRNLPESERYKAIQQAADEGDTDTLHAVFSGNSITTGVPKDKLAGLRSYAEKKLAGDLHARKANLDKVESLNVSILERTMEIMPTAAGDLGVQNEFKKQAAEHDQARLAFNASLSK
jgi:hypothetical protein